MCGTANTGVITLVLLAKRVQKTSTSGLFEVSRRLIYTERSLYSNYSHSAQKPKHSEIEITQARLGSTSTRSVLHCDTPCCFSGRRQSAVNAEPGHQTI